MSYWTRGHVGKAEFAAEVRAYCAELEGKCDWWDRFFYTEEHVEHTYYRNVPVGRPGEMLMYPCANPGRGAYPVTEIDIDRACNNYRYEQVVGVAIVKAREEAP